MNETEQKILDEINEGRKRPLFFWIGLAVVGALVLCLTVFVLFKTMSDKPRDCSKAGACAQELERFKTR